MRKLILQMQMSVDEYIAKTDRSLDWLVWDWSAHWTWDDGLKKQFNDIFKSIDCILLSRKLAEGGYMDHWRNAAGKFPQDPSYAFARKITETEKVVFSKKLKKSKWDEAILSRDLTGKIRALKRGPGKNIIAFGGVSFASALLEKGLVDEFQFFVNPTALGKGLSIFKPLHKPLGLDLIGSNSYGCGIVVNKYVSARKTV